MEIPKELLEKLKKKAEEAGFESAEKYVIYVLEQMVEEKESSTEYSAEEEKALKKGLKDLGYL